MTEMIQHNLVHGYINHNKVSLIYVKLFGNTHNTKKHLPRLEYQN